MEWILSGIEQETDHRFLNLYTLRYKVVKDGMEEGYSYFLASRRNQDRLVAKTGDFSRADAVHILVVRQAEEPEVLLIEQFRPALNSTVVEMPAGLLDGDDESEIQAAERESIEETGVRLKNVRLICPPSPTSSGLSDELSAVVEGEVDVLAENHLEHFEDISARFVPMSEIPALLEDRSKVLGLTLRLALLYLLEKYR